ncbi:testis-expressed protein 36 [Protopterus annectens]|uniref:testis-expressed protein 36 n=1 Tax=Protopterus annectens TaxID=7888 RepID=UPI001CF9400A|nr:testis-expressed protein 36 [Protopterus annectens]
MPKGRRNNPSTKKDGEWLPQIDIPPFSAVSATRSMLSWQPKVSQKELTARLPEVYKINEEKLAKREFPFSAIDNKHALRNKGEYFIHGIGRRKVDVQKSQHTSQKCNLFGEETPNEETARLTSLSFYQTTYVGNQNTVHTIHRRFPKDYTKQIPRATPPTESNVLWFGKDSIQYRTPLHVLAATQYPNPYPLSKLSPWKYSYRPAFPENIHV